MVGSSHGKFRRRDGVGAREHGRRTDRSDRPARSSAGGRIAGGCSGAVRRAELNGSATPIVRAVAAVPSAVPASAAKLPVRASSPRRLSTPLSTAPPSSIHGHTTVSRASLPASPSVAHVPAIAFLLSASSVQSSCSAAGRRVSASALALHCAFLSRPPGRPCPRPCPCWLTSSRADTPCRAAAAARPAAREVQAVMQAAEEWSGGSAGSGDGD